MSKETSTVIKGVAILLMLFLHLFYKPTIVDMCMPLIYIDGTPLVNILTRAANPVAFFLILSGYGLQAVCYDRGEKAIGLKSQLRRLLKLYIYYWIVLLVFVSIGSFIRPEVYPGDALKIICNITSWNTTYNFEHWFLFPYALLCLTAWPVFKLIDILGKTVSVIGTLLLSFACGWVISRSVRGDFEINDVVMRLVLYLELLFSFVAGAVMCRVARERGLRIKMLYERPWMTMALLVVLVAGRCLLTTGAFHPIYVVAFILLFIQLDITGWLRRFLLAMGKHSMPMWFIHTFFSTYLFHDFIYGFRYPVVIYLVLLGVSYLVSFPIMWAGNWVVRRMVN